MPLPPRGIRILALGSMIGVLILVCFVHKIEKGTSVEKRDTFTREVGPLDLSSHMHLTIAISSNCGAEIEPCGCTTPKTGGIARRATLYRHLIATLKDVILIDAGGSLFGNEDRIQVSFPDHAIAKAKAMADWYKLLPEIHCLLGESDFAEGLNVLKEVTSGMKGRFVCSNVNFEPWDGVVRDRLVEVGGSRIGLSSFLNLPQVHAKYENAQVLVELANQESLLGKLREQGADLVIVAVDSRSSMIARIADHDGHIPLVMIERNGKPLSTPMQCDNRIVVSLRPRCTSILLLEVYLARVGGKRALWRSLHLYNGLKKLEERTLKQLSVVSQRDADEEVRLTKSLKSLQDQLRSEGEVATNYSWWSMSEVTLNDDFKVDSASELLVHNVRNANSSPATIGGNEGKPPIQLYVGLDSCRECHAQEAENWSRTRHALAWQNLDIQKEQNPYTNPECLSCHVTGVGFTGGPQELEGISHLQAVQCESCHVPQAAEHKFANVRPATCQGCHTQARDPKFSYKEYLPYASCQNTLEVLFSRPQVSERR